MRERGHHCQSRSESPREFGERLQALRAAIDQQQYMLARMAGVSVEEWKRLSQRAKVAQLKRSGSPTLQSRFDCRRDV